MTSPHLASVSAAAGPRATAEPATSELVREAAGLAGELFRLELAMAKDELAVDLRALKVSAIAWAIALPSALSGVVFLLVAAIWVGGPMVALGVGVGLVVLAVAAGVVAYASLPKQPMSATMRRLRVNRALLRGHLS